MSRERGGAQASVGRAEGRRGCEWLGARAGRGQPVILATEEGEAWAELANKRRRGSMKAEPRPRA